MRVQSRSAKIYCSRFAQMIALSGVVAMAACQDATGPEEVTTAAQVPELRASQSSAGPAGTPLLQPAGNDLSPLPRDPRRMGWGPSVAGSRAPRGPYVPAYPRWLED